MSPVSMGCVALRRPILHSWRASIAVFPSTRCLLRYRAWLSGLAPHNCRCFSRSETALKTAASSCLYHAVASDFCNLLSPGFSQVRLGLCSLSFLFLVLQFSSALLPAHVTKYVVFPQVPMSMSSLLPRMHPVSSINSLTAQSMAYSPDSMLPPGKVAHRIFPSSLVRVAWFTTRMSVEWRLMRQTAALWSLSGASCRTAMLFVLYGRYLMGDGVFRFLPRVASVRLSVSPASGSLIASVSQSSSLVYCSRTVLIPNILPIPPSVAGESP